MIKWINMLDKQLFLPTHKLPKQSFKEMREEVRSKIEAMYMRKYHD